MLWDMSSYGSLSPPVTTLAINQTSEKLLVGTRGGELFEISYEDGEDLNRGPLVNGHYTGQVNFQNRRLHKKYYSFSQPHSIYKPKIISKVKSSFTVY